MDHKNEDIFDQIMSLPGLRIFNSFYKKYKSVLLYIFFGGLTTVVSIGTFAVCNSVLEINELISNVFSWIAAVTFAYVTNKIWVFQSKVAGQALIKEALSFYGGRLATLFIEEMLLLVFVTFLKMNGLVIKTVAQFVVLVLNYVISKIFIFKNAQN